MARKTIELRKVRSRVGLPVVSGSDAPRGESAPVTYYDIPFLKPPTWHWQIAAYFFLEGISSGALLLGSLAELVGPERYRSLARTSTAVAAIAFIPCPPLLIADLGRPERFHHMLRIFKPTSPMSHGSWALVAYSVPLGLLAAKDLATMPGMPRLLRRIARSLPRRLLAALAVPCALVLATYPGVLLATTSNPLWSRGRLLGALFAASAVHSGAAAIALFEGGEGGERLGTVERIASIAEAAAIAGFVGGAGDRATALTARPSTAGLLAVAVAGGLAAPAIVDAVAPTTGRPRRVAAIVGSALALAGAAALKWALTRAGHTAASDASGSHDAFRSDRDGSRGGDLAE